MSYIELHSRGRPSVFFRIHRDIWLRLCQVAQEYGWQPAGTIPTLGDINTSGSGSWRAWREHGNFPADYEPEKIKYEKLVKTQDALELANALDRAIKAGALPGINIQPVPLANSDLTIIFEELKAEPLRQFISFCRIGAFSFSQNH